MVNSRPELAVAVSNNITAISTCRTPKIESNCGQCEMGVNTPSQPELTQPNEFVTNRNQVTQLDQIHL